jgi:hypothetical protein
MLSISIVKVRQFLISIWHSLKTPPAEKVVEDKLGGVPEPQIKRAERRLERSRRRKVKVS